MEGGCERGVGWTLWYSGSGSGSGGLEGRAGTRYDKRCPSPKYLID